MATRIELYEPNPAYFAEATSPQFNTPTATTLSSGIDYVVSLNNGPVLLWFEKAVGDTGATNIISFTDSFGRVADIAQTFTATGIYTRKFQRQGWADAAGDLNFNVEVDTVITLIPIKL